MENTKCSHSICQHSRSWFWGACTCPLWRGGQGSPSQTSLLWVLSNPLFLLTKACTNNANTSKSKGYKDWGCVFRFTSTHTDSLDNTGGLLVVLAAARSRILHTSPCHAHHLYSSCPSLQHLFHCFLVTLVLLVDLWLHCWVCFFAWSLLLLWWMDTLVDGHFSR